jgi:hypothetical protein
MSPAKRKPKIDDEDDDTVYAADVDIDDPTYQAYYPRPTRSRRTVQQDTSPTKKRKLQPVARDPQPAPSSGRKISEDENTIVVARSGRRLRITSAEQENEEVTQHATSEPQEESEEISGDESEEVSENESEEDDGDESEQRDSYPASGKKRQRPVRLRTQPAGSGTFEASSDGDSEQASSQEVGELEEEEEAEEEVTPKPRRRKALPAEKKRTVDVKKASGASPQVKKGGRGFSDTTSNLLEEFRVPLDRRWNNCNIFVKLVNNGSISPPKNARHDYKPMPTPRPACYVKDLPEQKGRKYVLVEKSVRLYTIQSDGHTVKVWRLEIRNTSVRGAQPFQIFRHPVMGTRGPRSGKTYVEVSHNNPLTQRVCAEQDDAIRLGRIYADLMNRTPMDFKDKGWDTLPYKTHVQDSGVPQMAHVRRFVELASLLQWKPDLDFNLFTLYFINHPKGSAIKVDISQGRKATHGAYGRAMPVRAKKTSIEVKIFGVAFLHANFSDSEAGEAPINVRIADVDVSTTGPRIDVPSGYTFANTYLNSDGPKKVGPHDMSDAKTRAAYRVAQWVHYRLNGMTGTTEQLKTSIDSMVNEHLTQPKDRFSARSYNNSSLVQKPVLISGNFVHIVVSRHAARSLGCGDTGSLPTVGIRSTNRICHAYVINRLLLALRAGKSLVHAVQEFFTAADEVDLGLHKVRDIKNSFCLCLPTDRCNTEHPCMHCYRVLLCDELVRDTDGRTLCTNCAVRTDIADERLSLKSYLTSLVRQSYKRDKRDGTNRPKLNQAAVVDHLMRKYSIDDETWKDGYDGKVSLLVSRYTDAVRFGISGHAFRHPKQPSLEKAFPAWLDKEDNKLYLHHRDNLILTLLCTNLGNPQGIPAMIAWDKFALHLMEHTQKKYETPCVGYPAPLAEHWKGYERASDNIYAIGMMLPQSVRRRTAALRAYANSEAFETLKRQLKSGIFEGTVPARAYTGRAELRSLQKRIQTDEFMPWSPARIGELSGLLKFMESSPHFNPYGLRFPRNPDGSPWFWRPDHRPSNVDWMFINREFQARLWTMDEWCDEQNETPESACTIFLFYAIFFLRTGGKCHFYGCILTYASGHTAVYSIGRAVVILNNAGQFVRDVVAGEAMRSGFSSLDPTDLMRDFDFANCTIIIESWRANALRSNFPGGRAVIDTLKETVRQRAAKTEFYGPTRVAEKYTEIPPTGRYVPTDLQRRWRLADGRVYSDANRFEELENEEDEDEYEFEEEDNEDEDELESFDNIEVDEEQPYDSEEEMSEEESDESGDVGAAVRGGGSPGYATQQQEGEGSGDSGPSRLEGRTTRAAGYALQQEQGDESGEVGATVLEGGTPGDDGYALQQEEGAGGTTPEGDYEPRRKGKSILSILTYANDANISAVEISLATMARLAPRDTNTTFLPNSVSDNHPLAEILIVTGIWPNTMIGYPTTDNFFTSTDGYGCGTFNDDGDVFDPELNFLGNILTPRYE